MDFLTNIFGCCFPGRRRSQGGSDETSPLLSDNTNQNNSSSSSANQNGSQSNRNNTQQAVPQPSSSTTAALSQQDDGGDQIQQLEPAYSVHDLAVITGWARSQFFNINDPHVLSKKGEVESNKRKSFVQYSDGDQQSECEGEGGERDQQAKTDEVSTATSPGQGGIAF